MARPGWRPLLLAAVLGTLVATGQAPLHLWWLALAALGGLSALIAHPQRAWQTLWLGWVGGAGYFAAALFWIVEPFLVDVGRYGWMAPFALILMSFGMALFWALAAGVAALAPGRGGRVLGFAIGLAATDMLRSYVFTGFPWALIGHIWIGTPVAQGAALVGPVGLSLLATLVVAVPMTAVTKGGRLVLSALALAVLAAAWVGGEMRLAQPDPPRERPIRVRLIQPNASQQLKWRGDMWRVFLERQMAATAAPAAEPLDLIVWPEVAVPFLLGRSGDLLAEIARVSGGVPVALGIQREQDLRFFNSLAVIDGHGRVSALYDKWHLVPFGEYMPMGEVLAEFGIGAFAAREGFGYTAGTGARVLDLGTAGKVLPLICYESVFPQDLRAAPERADWVLQVTNDGWFGNLAGPYQHLAQARLRAVEQGLPLLRAANTGISAVIDAKGRLLQSLPLNSAGFLDAAVPAALPATPYARTGDLPLSVLLLCAIGAMILRRRHNPIDHPDAAV
ncbi:MAG: apolipoprotein N-acyltransferase [Rhodobacteraceae bacterium]|nr:apolipoprotein N-acyltransferase [Paracoccaceae bacterium]MCP5342672.1 apolipoprotein N-acyltransferase [Paracoccaceae bacterium]